MVAGDAHSMADGRFRAMVGRMLRLAAAGWRTSTGRARAHVRKLEALWAVVESLRAAGYSFVRLDEAAKVFGHGEGFAMAAGALATAVRLGSS